MTSQDGETTLKWLWKIPLGQMGEWREVYCELQKASVISLLWLAEL